jgi:hypothetical protein
MKLEFRPVLGVVGFVPGESSVDGKLAQAVCAAVDGGFLRFQGLNEIHARVSSVSNCDFMIGPTDLTAWSVFR